ncbi:ACT domain-containing protein [Oenococcus sicerae]|mgnify:CR=1 FL=1|uniref:UPF0237 protein DLJ48_07555 n=1 Tax=Oenococcus sicerae TaxID=2203724 RepID=A0AAJ1VNA5_9LACO|nr:ACT domain-containing protein [Oenococcus sicerae]MDN6899694.1 ACT domain-containing protein [Oenococcus sicerae]QAS70385.1 ACT domain-containing protein [Oenococcus sicerae]VDK14213.1 hypothetical protein OAL24_01013 [Oenococcus sicerae]
MKRAVVTVIGKDKTGIIAEVARTLADNQANILDVSQTLMDDIFTMSMLVDITDIDAKFTELQTKLTALGAKLSISIQVQREEIFNSISQI